MSETQAPVTPAKPPTISLSKPFLCGQSVSVNGVAKPSEGATIKAIEFDWGDGGTERRFFPAVHAYATPGPHQIKATAIQSDDLVASAQVDVTLSASNGKPPTLTLFKPEVTGLAVSVNGATSPGDAVMSITRIEWRWGDGLTDSAFFPADHRYAAAGSYQVAATAHQCDGQTASATATLVLGN